MNDIEIFSSGIPSLDETLQGIHAGDNIVFQVDRIQDFHPFVKKYCEFLKSENKKLVYFRFAEHPSFIPDDMNAEIHILDPKEGFEQFIFEILNVIENNGKNVYYLFDCLSGLAAEWYSDRMLGNFFQLACPYLYVYDTITYFVLLRNQHTSIAVNAIHHTAQVILDVFSESEKLYLLPVKVFQRFSPTMYMLHSYENNVFHPVTKSIFLAKILSSTPQPWIDVNIDRHDTWSETFFEAQRLLNEKNQCTCSEKDATELKTHLIKMAITRDEHLYGLCEKYFDISNLVDIGKRMIGSGLIGGKTIGMLLARRIIEVDDSVLAESLETHDSFYVGSDVFYSYIIQNECWWERHHLRLCNNNDIFYKKAEVIHAKLMKGNFPHDIIEQFKQMLSYFGQSPIIVRSSSLQEDAYGNSFSGKYESVFCANQGTPEERLKSFLNAVRIVYASTMSHEALSYRIHRGLFHQDEQMALLVQRVSGEYYGDLYFPQAAGVAYSFNPFVWNKQIDPNQGVIRIVFGLGTRAVDRIDDDYTRVAALNIPMLRPEGSDEKARRYTQRIVHVLDLKKNMHTAMSFEDIVSRCEMIPLEIFASIDTSLHTLTFEKLLTKTLFTDDMKQILQLLHKAYNNAVDIEFTVNFVDTKEFKINLLQCRPFQFTGELLHIEIPENLLQEDILLETNGPLIGHSTSDKIDRIIYICPEEYSNLPLARKYSVAQIIGTLTNDKKDQQTTMLIGPGRWGSRMPELGVPVNLSEIKNVSILCEVAEMHEGLNPDLSLGTHFFNDLVDQGILYMGVSPLKAGDFINKKVLLEYPNKFLELQPDYKNYEKVIHIIDFPRICGKTCPNIYADTIEQKGIVFLAKRD